MKYSIRLLDVPMPQSYEVEDLIQAGILAVVGHYNAGVVLGTDEGCLHSDLITRLEQEDPYISVEDAMFIQECLYEVLTNMVNSEDDPLDLLRPILAHDYFGNIISYHKMNGDN